MHPGLGPQPSHAWQESKRKAYPAACLLPHSGTSCSSEHWKKWVLTNFGKPMPINQKWLFPLEICTIAPRWCKCRAKLGADDNKRKKPAVTTHTNGNYTGGWGKSPLVGLHRIALTSAHEPALQLSCIQFCNLFATLNISNFKMSGSEPKQSIIRDKILIHPVLRETWGRRRNSCQLFCVLGELFDCRANPYQSSFLRVLFCLFVPLLPVLKLSPGP